MSAIRLYLMYVSLAALAALLPALVWAWLHGRGTHPCVRLLSRFRRQALPAQLLLAAVVVRFVVIGSTKTNEERGGWSEERGGESEEVGARGLDLFPLPSSLQPLPSSLSPLPSSLPPPSFRLVGVATNETFDFTMPEDAVSYTPWRLRGAAEDWVRVGSEGLGSWRFPMGTNGYSSFRVFTDGTIRPKLHSTNDTLAAVGSPMSAIPTVSRFWYAAGTNDSRVLTWENFALGRIPAADTDSGLHPFISAQLELFPSGDWIARSNGVERTYRRINPDDWDGDGLPNAADAEPFESSGEFFGPRQHLPEGANTNAYCWIEVVTRADSLVTFAGDGASDLADPVFIARADATNRVALLIGKTYDVTSAQPIAVTARSSSSVELSDVTPSSFRVVWPVTAEAEQVDGSAFTMRVTPSFLNGLFQWDASCCPVVWNGASYGFGCSGCGCGGCSAHGGYVYEGYRLPVDGGWCGCSPVVGPLFAGLSEFAFSKAAVIYEDPYTNMPGVVVTPPSSNSVLRCVAHGGAHGGRLTIGFDAGGDRIAPVGNCELPDETMIAAGAERTFEIEYRPVSPSVAITDIVARAVFVENDTQLRQELTSALTSVKLQLEAVYEAPENKNPNRHIYGVGEKIIFRITPHDFNIQLESMKQDSDYSGYNYELFSGLERTSAYEDKMYVCPISSTYQPKTSIIIFDAKYIPFIEVVEPHDVITPSASWGENAVDFFYNGNRRCWQPGEVGSASLVTINYIGPMWVSFRGVSFSEIPCYEEDEITGCFTNGHTRTHTVSAGAGAIHYIQDGNYFFTDSACSNSPERNWLANSTMIWRIPIGWHRIDHLVSDGTVVEGVDYERSGDIDSRPLLIGNCTDYYTQARHIDATGVYRTDKFGHWISRSPNCRVILDGNIMQDHHAE